MELLRWMGVSPPSTSTGSTTGANENGNGNCNPNANTAGSSTGQVASSADAKRFGLENFGNTCYANSVLQALYFCEPFRELVTLQQDKSSLYPPQAPLPLPALPVPTNPSSNSNSPQTLKPNQPSYSSATTSTSKPSSSGARSTSSSKTALPASKKSADSRGHKRPLSSHDGTTATEEERDAYGQNLAPEIPNNPPSLFVALRSLFVHISGHNQEKGTVAPQAFIAKLKRDNELFRSTMHQDAHEFLNYLINRVVEDLEQEDKLGREEREREREREKQSRASTSDGPREDLSASVTTTTSTDKGKNTPLLHPDSNSRTSTWVHELFEGTLTSETRCLTCETVSSRSETFLDLSIDIEQNSSITACLRQFSASEMLCQRNKFFCDSCCGLQEAEKRMKIKRVPEVLVVHLKRFKYQEEEGKYIKLNYRVAWPFELRLFNTVDDFTAADGRPLDRLYELWAIVVHIGGGPLHGHYITLIKAQGTWYLFDDGTVDTIKESDIPKYYGDSGSGTGYVLFYQAVDLDREKLGLRPKVTASTGVHANGILHTANHSGVANGDPAADVSVLLPENAVLKPTSRSSSPAAIDIDVLPSPLLSPPGTEIDASLPPSPSVPLTFASNGGPSTKLEIPSRGHSPISPNGPLPAPPPIQASVAAGATSSSSSGGGGGGGFFSTLGSLRHSKSVKVDRTSLGLGHHVKGALNGDALNTTLGHEEKEKEKEKLGWLSFRSKEKRRESGSQTTPAGSSHTGSQSALLLNIPSNVLHASPSTPSSPVNSTTPVLPPPSPITLTTGRRMSTSTNPNPNIGSALPPLPTTSPPLPPLPTAPLPPASVSHVVVQQQQQQQHTPTRRMSTTDGPPTTVDGSDSFSGSSSWTSGVGPALEIPPVPKELPPVPPLPAPIPIPIPTLTPIPIPTPTPTSNQNANDALSPANEPLVLNVGSGQGTIAPSPVPSTWSMPTTPAPGGRDVRSEGERLPTATISSVTGNSSSTGLSEVSALTQPGAPLSATIPPTPSSTNQQQQQQYPPSSVSASSSQARITEMSTRDGVKETAKARKAAEAVAKRTEEERKRAEKQERERMEKAEKEQHKLAKRTSRKMSLGLSGFVGWANGAHRDRDKDKDRDRGTNSYPGTSSSSRKAAVVVGANGTS